MKNKVKQKRLNSRFWYGYWGAFGLLKKDVLTNTEEFKKIDVLLSEKKSYHDLDLKWMMNTYMESTILAMAKIFGVNQSDDTGLSSIIKRLNAPHFRESKAKMKKLQKKHKSLISKVKENRNRIIGHLDFFKNPYHKMKLSPDTIEQIYTYTPYIFRDKNSHADLLRKVKANTGTNQRRNQQYWIPDFKKDISTFKSIVGEIDKIVDQINQLFYTNAPKKINMSEKDLQK